MLEKATPQRRIAPPEELIGAALYLAADASNFTTGSVLVVDGGFSLGVNEVYRLFHSSATGPDRIEGVDDNRL